MKIYREKHFSLFRIILGATLVYYFFSLIPFFEEIYSRQALAPTTNQFPWIFFPGLFSIFNSTHLIGPLLFLGGLCSFCFMLGFYRKLSAFLIWYLLASLVAHNYLASNISKDYLGWLLLSTLLIPQESLWSLQKGKKNWQIPSLLIEGAWWIFGLSYTASAINKMLLTSVWFDGEAIFYYLHFPIARDTLLVEFMTQLPSLFLQALTWLTLCLEFLAGPLCIFKRSRFFIWCGLTGMHLFIISTSILTQMSFSILLFHFFIFDTNWLKKFNIPIFLKPLRTSNDL